MMQIGVVTLFPEMFHALNSGITGRAQARSLWQLHCFNPREASLNAHGTVDDRPYGGGPGMVLAAQPLADTIAKAKQALGPDCHVISFSPQGQRFDQRIAARSCRRSHLLLVCGRYEGIDERLVHYIDTEWSIGDYVLSGGEFAAMVVIDAIVRLLPGVLGDPYSSLHDSFAEGILDHPHYTRPITFAGQSVPQVLRSGDHNAIACWRRQQALGRTWLRRPELLQNFALSQEDKNLLNEFITNWSPL